MAKTNPRSVKKKSTPQSFQAGGSIGLIIAAIIMVLGYGIIAVPTGIVSAEFVMQRPKIDTNTQHCPHCSNDSHKDNAVYCHKCGGVLNDI